MKLSELKNVGIIVEGRVDPNVLLSIQNIIADGKVTDSFQILMLVRILEMLKYGAFYREANFYKTPSNWDSPEPIPSQVEVIAVLKALPPAKQVDLAKKFLELLTSKNEDQLSKLIDITSPLTHWINFVTAREAND